MIKGQLVMNTTNSRLALITGDSTEGKLGIEYFSGGKGHWIHEHTKRVQPKPETLCLLRQMYPSKIKYKEHQYCIIEQ